MSLKNTYSILQHIDENKGFSIITLGMKNGPTHCLHKLAFCSAATLEASCIAMTNPFSKKRLHPHKGKNVKEGKVTARTHTHTEFFYSLAGKDHPRRSRRLWQLCAAKREEQDGCKHPQVHGIACHGFDMAL